ncbi:MAG: GAF domain-containing protein [Cyanobacteria bacterium CRU_2_1]|nr:GAF domain-containing protein [Cyanobacteria bacterium CRU_2_1]
MQPGISTNATPNNYSRHPMSQPPFWRYLMIIGAIAIAYFLTARLALSMLNLGFEASPLWPPAGIALTALLWHEQWAWTGVAIGVFLLNHSVGAPVDLSLGSILSSTTQAIVGAFVLKWVKFDTSLKHLRDVLQFIGLGVLATPIVNATLGTLAACLIGYIEWNQAAQNWWTIWLGDGMGILVFTPLLLAMRSRRVKLFLATSNLFDLFSSRRVLEKVVWLASLILVSWIVFYTNTGEAIATYPLEYLPFPLVMWAALRFGQVRAVLASFILSIIAIGGTISGHGPFIAKADDPRQVVLLLQAFIGVITITAMILAAVMAEHQQAEQELRVVAEHNRLVGEMALRIRQSLDLDEILYTTVEEVRRFLSADRVFFCCFDANGQGEVVAESVESGWTSVLGATIDPASYYDLQNMFSDGQICIVEDAAQIEETSPFVEQYYHHYQIKANIGVPITLNDQPCDWTVGMPEFGILKRGRMKAQELSTQVLTYHSPLLTPHSLTFLTSSAFLSSINAPIRVDGNPWKSSY